MNQFSKRQILLLSNRCNKTSSSVLIGRVKRVFSQRSSAIRSVGPFRGNWSDISPARYIGQRTRSSAHFSRSDQFRGLVGPHADQERCSPELRCLKGRNGVFCPSFKHAVGRQFVRVQSELLKKKKRTNDFIVYQLMIHR